SEAELFRRSSVVSKKNHGKDVKKTEVRYAISYEHYPVVNNMIFYESLSGGRIMGNPYAVFEQVYSDSNFKNYIHVWVIRSFSVIPDELKNKDNVIFVKKDSDAYFRYISSAKYLICNSTFSEYFVIKTEQIYLQTRHGIFYKTVVRYSNFNNYIHVWVIRSFSVIPDELKNKDNVIFVKKDSDAYFRYISSAKYLICHSTFSEYFVRKTEQFYLQTSHGIFYKTVGRDSKGSPTGVAGSTRNLLQATHIIVPNDFMAEKQPK